MDSRGVYAGVACGDPRHALSPSVSDRSPQRRLKTLRTISVTASEAPEHPHCARPQAGQLPDAPSDLAATPAPHCPDPSPYPLLQADPIRWDYPQPARIVAIGDLHGDLKAFAALAYEAELIDQTGHWTGGDTHLVLLGDLVGGHKDSRLLLDMVMRLEAEARTRGGHVHALLGNRDLLPVEGHAHVMTPKEINRFKRGTPAGDAFRGHTPYAKWIRRRSVILRIGEYLFVHGGLDRWALLTAPERINATVRAWIRHWQMLAPPPPEDTRWVVASEVWCQRVGFPPGPCWNRSLKVKSGPTGHYHSPSTRPMDAATLKAILKRWQARRLVVGHSPLASGQILLVHPTYQRDVIMVDTCISQAYGTLSALTIAAEQTIPLYVHSRENGRRVKFHEKRRADWLVDAPSADTT